LRTDGADILSLDEIQRRDDIKHELVADRFVLGRILLRRVLAQYLGEDPARLAFQYNANGKPELVDQTRGDVGFNLSHSGTTMVLAVAAAPAVGVDIESVDRADTVYRISQQFFSSAEIQRVKSLGTKGPSHALTLWCLKESIVKANGDTVWDGLSKISLATEGRRVRCQLARHGELPAWQLAAGAFGENHFLAVAVKRLSNQGHRPLIFRTFRLGLNTADPTGFIPEFST
jgi:4'-phosphopantetheinyl transferase